MFGRNRNEFHGFEIKHTDLNPNFLRLPDPPFSSSRGRWVIYYYGNSGGAEARSIHMSPIEAIKAMVWGEHIAWWPNDIVLRDAIDQWNNRKHNEGDDDAVRGQAEPQE